MVKPFLETADSRREAEVAEKALKGSVYEECQDKRILHVHLCIAKDANSTISGMSHFFCDFLKNYSGINHEDLRLQRALYHTFF